jgi:hypothetical protein
MWIKVQGMGVLVFVKIVVHVGAYTCDINMQSAIASIVDRSSVI